MFELICFQLQKVFWWKGFCSTKELAAQPGMPQWNPSYRPWTLYVALTWVYQGFWVCPCLAGLCRAADSLPHNVSSIPWSSPFVQVGIQPSPSYWTVLNRACVPWLQKKNLWFIFISSLCKWPPSLSSFHLCLGVCDFFQWENCNFLLREGPTWEVYHIVREAQRISLAHSCWTSTGSSRFLSLLSQPSEISISS